MSFGAFLGTVIGWCSLSVLMIVTAWWLRSNDADFRAKAARALATVVENGRTEYRDRNNRKQVDKYDVYEFTAASGQRVRFKSANTIPHPPQRVGAQAEIMYDPSRPVDARLADDSMNTAAKLILWFSPVGVVIAGLVSLLWLKTRTH